MCGAWKSPDTPANATMSASVTVRRALVNVRPTLMSSNDSMCVVMDVLSLVTAPIPLPQTWAVSPPSTWTTCPVT